MTTRPKRQAYQTWDKLKIKLEMTESVSTFTQPALCHEHEDPDLWYSEGTDNGRRGGNVETHMLKNMERSHQALQICNACPSKATCLTEGMRKENLDWGIWGGLMAGERLVKASEPILSSDRKNKVSFAKRVRERYYNDTNQSA